MNSTTNINIGAIILARADSKRLPGKVLLKIDGKNEIFSLLYKNLESLNIFSKVIIATSRDFSDDSIIEVCKLRKMEYFRGDKNNVLQRFTESALSNKFDYVCRFNADSPFLSKELILRGIKKIRENNFHLITNTIMRSYPYGITFQSFSTNFLELISQKNQLSDEEKEHISPISKYLKSHEIAHLKNKFLNMSNYRMVIDNKEDLENINKLNITESSEFFKWKFYARFV